MSLQLRAEIATTETDDGLVLLDERTGRYWQLNATAALVLQALGEGRSSESIAEDLVARYHIEPDQATHDVTAIIDRLAAANLVQRR